MRKYSLLIDLKETASEPVDVDSKVWYAVASFLQQFILNGALCLLHLLQKMGMKMQGCKVISEECINWTVFTRHIK